MKTNFRARSRQALLSIAIVSGITMLGPAAQAQCSRFSPRPVAWQALPLFVTSPLGDLPASAGTTEPRARGGNVSIVGLWKMTFTSGGQVVDQAFEVFHDDGTELMVDTSAPSSGNVCVGVWAKTDGLTFQLNHPSWTFNDQGILNGTATIKLSLTITPDGNQVTGTFTVDVLTLAGTNILHETGTVAGQRVSVQ
jgi:hypothetical protein